MSLTAVQVLWCVLIGALVIGAYLMGKEVGRHDEAKEWAAMADHEREIEALRRMYDSRPYDYEIDGM